ncbi:MAG: sigma 54-interacting transcriptional regulator [Sandaracinaceae bacterium]|nr:sigma 54-interacting transcriptional regulator [Sandaracinaceae bacterium]
MSQSSWDDPDRWTSDMTSAGGFGLEVRRFGLTMVGGKHPVEPYESTSTTCTIGAHARNDYVLPDPTVSRFHAEIEVSVRGARIRDLESRNGTFVDGVRVDAAWLGHGSTVRVGKTLLRFDALGGTNRVALSRSDMFGTLYGASAAMRAVFAILERVAPSDATVLIEGETGTGKEEVAASIHGHSKRASGPFVTLDCGAIPPNLLESELFGHDKGAFTGAIAAREGVFEAADGGTLFLDELGELPLGMQPALLRVLERGEVRRVGETAARPIDVRVVAATNRDLRQEVTAGRFREDLYYRLAVFHLRVPPLRERPEDIEGLTSVLLRRMGLSDADIARVVTPELRTALQAGRWPGNVRELRNYLSRCVVLGEVLPITPTDNDDPRPWQVDPEKPYAEAREHALALFERDYVRALLEHHEGNVSAAARAAGMARPYLHRLLRRHGLR